MKITKQEALHMLAKIGERHLICDAALTLPDEIDIDRDQNLLARFGLDPSHLMDRFGASP
jgi:hypothetical protein